MIEPTEQELQMIEIIREQKFNFQLVIGNSRRRLGSGAFSALVQIRCCRKRGAAEVFPMPGIIWRQRTSKPFTVSTCWAPFIPAEHSACSPPQPGSWMVALS